MLYYYAFPREHWRSLRTNNPLDRILRKVRRRTRAVGAFPDVKSALMRAAARLRNFAGTKWGRVATWICILRSFVLDGLIFGEQVTDRYNEARLEV